MGDETKAPKKKGKAKPPQLPPDAPQDVKDFVDCKSDKVTLDPAKKGFLPEIPVIGAPDVTVAAVAGKPGTAKITLKKTGLLDTSFTMTVTNGHLDVDTTGVTPQMVKDAIDRWVKRYNDWLDANNRRLDGIAVDRGRATVTKVAAGGAGGAGGAGQGGDGKGGGIKKAVGVGTAALLLGAGTYLGIQVLGSDDGGVDRSASSNTPGPDTQTDTETDTEPGAGAPDGIYSCDPVARCGKTYDALFQGVGTATTHDGSPVDPDALSNTRVVGLTTWTGPIAITADCAFGPTTGQAVPDAQGVFQIDLALYSYGPCEVVELKLRDGLTFNDGTPFRALDVAFTWDVQSRPTQIDQRTLRHLAEDWRMLEPEVWVDAKVVADVVSGRDLCFINVFSPDAMSEQLTRLCTPGLWIHGLQVAIPSIDPTVSGMYAVGGVQISDLDPAVIDGLFGDGGRFPCGVGELAVTLCPERAPTGSLDSAMLVQTVVPDGPAGGPVVFDLGDGTSVSVTTGTDGSRMSVTGDVQPYVIIRNQTMSVFVPDHRAEAFHVGDGPEVAPWPPIPYGGNGGDVPAAPEPGRTPTVASVRAFARDLAASLASDDKSFAVGHLDPAVRQVFPDGCEEHLAGLRDPTYAIEKVRLGAIGPYTYAPPSAGGVSVEVTDVLTVRARVTQAGRTQAARLHFGTQASQLTWFSDCGASSDQQG